MKPLGIALLMVQFQANVFSNMRALRQPRLAGTLRNFSCSLCGDNSCNSVSVSVSGAELVSRFLKERVMQRFDGML